ncbi:MAG TPA: biosynthetic peptidoglycan transglycosylase [Candidatus Dormibacteraeota bacterium]
MSTPARNRAPGQPTPGPFVEIGRGAKRQGRLGLVRVPAALLLLLGAAVAGYLGITTPSGDDLPQRVAGLSRGAPLRPADVPAVLEQAVVAVEDERFYAHHGLDTVGTARAVWVDLSGRCTCEGGSTITQQLAKTVYFPEEDRIARKLPGMAVALKIELRYDKRQILADYLSVVPTGYGLVGAREAACAYFGRPLADLTVGQAAELAGSVQAPSVTDPRYDPAAARARRDYVLERMVEVGYLDAAQAAAARAEPVLGVVPGRC